MSSSFEAPKNAAITVEQLAREMVEASRVIETLATRAAEQLEAPFFAYAKTLRKRAEAHLRTLQPADENANTSDSEG